MKDDNMKIEQRLQNMKNFYVKAENLIDKLPDAVSPKTKSALKDAILGDRDLNNLMEGVESHRSPRLFLILSDGGWKE